MGNQKFDLSVRNLNALVDLARFRPDRFDLFKLLLNPYIDGIEVTQGIQYYKAERHLTDANDRGEDNSVRLVANKPAWVRVYVRTGLLGSDTVITGELQVEYQALPFLWFPAGTFSPQPAGAVVTTQRDPDYATERSTLGATLNFILPQETMWGRLRLRAKIWPQGGDANAPVATHEVILDVTLKQTLSLRGILISYNGPDPTVNPANPPTINLPAPTVADLQATAPWTLTTNPVEAQGVFASAGTLNWGTPLTGVATNPGGCSIQWISLNAAVAQVMANDGNRTDVIYYGLLPTGTPIANVGGCESSGVSTGPNGVQVTMAHEVGHGAGLNHAPCNTPGDPNYPAYEPYDPVNNPTASLGEYGLDINDGTIHPPAEKDYMSYCGPFAWVNWISLYHHSRLINNGRFNPRTVGVSHWHPPELVDPFLWPWEYIPDPPQWERGPGDWRMKAERLISIIGVINETRELQVQSVQRVTALRNLGGTHATAFVAQLMGQEGRVIASAPVMRLAANGCGCGQGHDAEGANVGPFAFQALLSDTEPGAALRIVRRGRDEEPDKEVWVRHAPKHAPKIAAFEVRVSKEQGQAKWAVTGNAGQELEFALQYSKDAGKSWNGLVVGVRETSYQFALIGLPSGAVIFRLLAHNGFFTATTESKAVQIAPRPPLISILSPQANRPLVAGLPLRLWAAVTTDTGTRLDPEAYQWMVDGKEVGRGVEVWITAPKAGEHDCTLTVKGPGGQSQVRVKFATLDLAELAVSPSPRPAPPAPGQRMVNKKNRKSKK